jgi:hypothetical protein
MKPGAVNQAGLKSLQLLAGHYVVVNVNDHARILSASTDRTYKRPVSVCQAGRKISAR